MGKLLFYIIWGILCPGKDQKGVLKGGKLHLREHLLGKRDVLA